VNWAFFWGVVTGVGIIFVGALLWAGFYRVLSSGVIKHLEEGKQGTE
jgi:hypothetical protein